jgi:hemolysin-activating ACP:hemolysin acyltransferase
MEQPAQQVPPTELPELRVFQPQNPALALGLAVSHLMTKPAFAKLRFGEWSRILVGQINRKHYYFAVDRHNEIQGFVGWAVTTSDKAEAWLRGTAFSSEESPDGDCLVINAWSANSPSVNRFLLEEGRKVVRDKRYVYFKRYYDDGTAKPMRVRVNEFVARPADRNAPT